MTKQQVTLSLGANLPSHAGLPADTIRAALDDLADRAGKLIAVSSFYRTKAVTLDGDESVPDFVNACVLLETKLEPDALLVLLKELESAYGRVPAARWSARTLDIDLIGYGGLILPSLEAWREIAESDDPAAFTREPMVPHPRAHVRGFVLAPLNDVAPDWEHPVLKQMVTALYEGMEASGGCADVVKISAGA